MPVKILVVDDDPHICTLIAEFLGLEGHDARCAGDGLAALAEVERDPPDLIVTDLMMPRLDGTALVAKLHERGYRIPVVVITAALHQRPDALPQVAGFVCKPFDLDHLHTVVERVLEGIPL